MPATRSRTEHWRRSLEQLASRQGGLEISVPRPENGALSPEPNASGGDLIWRCRVFSVNDEEIVLEHPMVLGRPVDFAPGVGLVAIIAIGQNRWMFRTRVLGLTNARDARGNGVAGVRVAAPDDVERCQRRSFYRVSTMGLRLPHVEVRALLDPRTVVSAETANQAEIHDLLSGAVAGRIGRSAQEILLPEVGPPFFSTLVNIGGGGVGLMVDPLETRSLESGPYFWLRLNLTPQIPAPLGVTARLVHTHIDSSQRTYAGYAFDFRFNPSHERFVVDQLCRYVAQVQRDAMRGAGGPDNGPKRPLD
ncbi:MAG: flagellar brake protein [Phycisphaeraceae bacterium]|nr:flagellar brake protein [Phycisphaeraceae bacterium]